MQPLWSFHPLLSLLQRRRGLISLSSPSLPKKTVLPNVSTFNHCYSDKVSYLLLHQSTLLLNGYDQKSYLRLSLWLLELFSVRLALDAGI